MDNLYAEEIISHYEHPHNKGKIENASASFHAYNPLCGDELTIYVKINGHKIEDIKFEGNGCAVCIASASKLTDDVKGKDIGEVEKMDAKDTIRILGIDPGPARIKCATLSLKTLLFALYGYENKKATDAANKL